MKMLAVALVSAVSLVLAATADLSLESSAWVSQGRIITMLEKPGKAPSRRARLPFEPYSLAMTTGGGMIMYVDDSCRGRGEIRLRRTRGAETTLPGLGKLFNDKKVRVDGLALGASGRMGAFVARPCVTKAAAEVSEQAGVVYLVSPADLRITVLRGSIREGGGPVGMAMDPKFSPDEKELLVNYEGGFELFNLESGESVFSSTSLGASREGWTGAIGWLSGACVVFKTGSDWLSRDLKPPMVVNWHSSKVVTLGSLTGAPNEKSIGLTEVNSEHGIRRIVRGWEVVSMRGGSTIVGLPNGQGLVGLTAVGPRPTEISFCNKGN